MSIQTDNIASKDSYAQTAQAKPDFKLMACSDMGTQTPTECRTPTKHVSVQTPSSSEDTDKANNKMRLELNVQEALLSITGVNIKTKTANILDINGNNDRKNYGKNSENTIELDKIMESKISCNDKKSKKKLCFEDLANENKENDDKEKNFDKKSSDVAELPGVKEADEKVNDDVRVNKNDNPWQCRMADKWLQWTESSSYGQLVGPLVLGLYALLSVVMLIAADLEMSSVDAITSWLQTAGMAMVTILFIGMVGLLRFAVVPNTTLELD